MAGASSFFDERPQFACALRQAKLPHSGIDKRESRMATLQEITDRVKTAVGDDSGLGKTLKFDLKGDGFIHIDGGTVTNEDAPADLTMTISMADLLEMGAGKLDATMAFMSGRLKLSDMGLAMSLQPKMGALFAKMA